MRKLALALAPLALLALSTAADARGQTGAGNCYTSDDSAVGSFARFLHGLLYSTLGTC
jgi:hypothetical protein